MLSNKVLLSMLNQALRKGKTEGVFFANLYYNLRVKVRRKLGVRKSYKAFEFARKIRPRRDHVRRAHCCLVLHPEKPISSQYIYFVIVLANTSSL